MLRKANLKDVEVLTNLVLEFKGFDFSSLNNNESEKLEVNLKKVINQNSTFVLLWEIDLEVLGYATITIYHSLTDMEENAYLDELFLTQTKQNLGEGSKFLDAINNWCLQNEVTKLKLVTRPENQRAQHFYQKNFGIKKDKINYTFELR